MGPAVDEDRYLEFWNLVFMQYDLSHFRTKEDFDLAGELPKKNIDTGMGLERMASILQGVDNMYEIDEVRPILDKAVGAHRQEVRSQSVACGVPVAPGRRPAAGRSPTTCGPL